MAAAGYDRVVWIMGHNLSDDGAKQRVTVIRLEKSRVAWEQGNDSVCQQFWRVWMSSSVIAFINAKMVSLPKNNASVIALSSNGPNLRHRLQSAQSIFWLDPDRSGSLACQVF